MEITNSFSGFSTSLQGIQKSQAMMNKSAQSIATGEGDLAEETSKQIIAEKSQAANTETVRTKDEMLEELMHMQK